MKPTQRADVRNNSRATDINYTPQASALRIVGTTKASRRSCHTTPDTRARHAWWYEAARREPMRIQTWFLLGVRVGTRDGPTAMMVASHTHTFQVCDTATKRTRALASHGADNAHAPTMHAWHSKSMRVHYVVHTDTYHNVARGLCHTQTPRRAA